MTTKSSSSFTRLIQGNPYETHRDLNDTSSQFHRPTSSFRNQPPGGRSGIDEDLIGFSSPFTSSQYASTSSSSSSNSSYSTPHSTSHSINPSAAAESVVSKNYNSLESDESHPNAIFNLLNSTNLNESIYGNYSMDLREDQAADWKSEETDRSLPLDPLISSSKGKGKGKGLNSSNTGGSRTRTITEEEIILSSLSSLDLKERIYLQTLLSLPESDSILNYLSQGTYSQDIYGTSDSSKLQDILNLVDNKLQTPVGGKEEEEGRLKALRRLGSVMRHVWGEQSLDSSSNTMPSLERKESGGSSMSIDSEPPFTPSTPTPSSFLGSLSQNTLGEEEEEERWQLPLQASTPNRSEWDEDNAARSSYNTNNSNRFFNHSSSSSSHFSSLPSSSLSIRTGDQLSQTIHQLSHLNFKAQAQSQSTENMSTQGDLNSASQSSQIRQIISGNGNGNEDDSNSLIIELDEDHDTLSEREGEGEVEVEEGREGEESDGSEKLVPFSEFMVQKLRMLKDGS